MADSQTTTYVDAAPHVYDSDGVVMIEMGGLRMALTRYVAAHLQSQLTGLWRDRDMDGAEVVPLKTARQ